MKYLYATVAAGVLALSAGSVQAEERWPLWYVSLTGGWSVHGDSDIDPGNGNIDFEGGFDGGGGFTAALGYKPQVDGGLFGHSRLEAEFIYIRNQMENINGVSTEDTASNMAGMFNILFDIPTGTGLTPYVGAGIGLTSANFDGPPGLDGNDEALAGQLKAGLAYQHELIPYVDFLLGYRYLMSGDVSIQGNDVENDLHMVEAGARFNF